MASQQQSSLKGCGVAAACHLAPCRNSSLLCRCLLPQARPISYFQHPRPRSLPLPLHPCAAVGQHGLLLEFLDKPVKHAQTLPSLCLISCSLHVPLCSHGAARPAAGGFGQPLGTCSISASLSFIVCFPFSAHHMLSLHCPAQLWGSTTLLDFLDNFVKSICILSLPSVQPWGSTTCCWSSWTTRTAAPSCAPSALPTWAWRWGRRSSARPTGWASRCWGARWLVTQVWEGAKAVGVICWGRGGVEWGEYGLASVSVGWGSQCWGAWWLVRQVREPRQ